MTIGCIIQARMDSTRLPGKVMKKIDKNHTLLQFQIEQLKNCKKIDKIVIATTTESEDGTICQHIIELGLDVFRGKSDDVLDRYYNCAKKFNFSIIIRITSDNPLIDPYLVDNIISEFKKESFDYVSNIICRTFPHGTETEIFTFDALEKSWKESDNQYDREHVTPYMYNNPKIFKIHNVENKIDLSELKWTVDTNSDLDKVKKIVSKIKKRPIKTEDITKIYSQINNVN